MFRSFFLAGFECATGYNDHGDWIDQIAATHHDQHVDEDYLRLSQVGIHAAREAVRWPLVDLGCGRYDFSTLQPFLDASRRHRIEIIWDLFHYGYPHGCDPFSSHFTERFAAYCQAAARVVAQASEGTCWFTPINEPSYFSWAAGEAGRFAPHCHGRAQELKIALARAAIAGIDAIRAECPAARMVNADPLCRVVAPYDRPDLEDAAERFSVGAVFESWDMLCGRLLPELGGSRDHLDVVGINYYWTNQWELGREGHPLADDDARRWPLRRLVRRVWERYGGELMISETSHVGEMRQVWLREVAREAEALLLEGIPLRGVCLYPVLGMPEWHAPEQWAAMGLWDPCQQHGPRVRQPFAPMIQALREAQHLELVHGALSAIERQRAAG